MRLVEFLGQIREQEQQIEEAAGSNLWVRDLSNYRPISSNGSHWGRGQAGFNISESGRIYLTDNSEKDLKMSASEKLRHKAELGQLYPSHRDLTVGRGPDITAYSGIFTFEGKDAPTLWLYPDAEKALSKHPKMARGLASLIGVYNIGWSTPVRSNSSREVLFRLGDLMRKRKATEAVETPRLLYHGTLKKHIPAIKQTGLQPSIGYFVKKAYGETPDLKSVVFASEIRDMGKVTNAIVANVLADAGGPPITIDEFYELGAVVVLKYGKQFKHISYHDEEEDDIEHPFQAEPGDFYSYNVIEPYTILVDKRLERFLDNIGLYPPEMNDFVVADEEEREYWG